MATTTVTTPPPCPSLPLLGTPVNPRSGSLDRFGLKIDDQNRLFGWLSLDMSPYFTGPVPTDKFLDVFLPATVVTPTFRKDMFLALKASPKESTMYDNLVTTFIPNCESLFHGTNPNFLG